jgi:HK97 family phage prohead protease
MQVTSADREAELFRLNCLDLDLYLEQRVLYRRLVAMGSHAYRGVPVPQKPRCLIDPHMREKAQAASEPRATRERIVRTFPASLIERSDGRTLEALVVPYDVPTVLSDNGGPRYEETWRYGAFEEQIRAANGPKVFVNVEHEQGIRGVVGHGIELREEQSGLHGVFELHESDDGRKALHLVRAGLLTGLSLEAIALRSIRRGGAVERVKARLDAVALTRRPAYKDARVLAVRGNPS